MASRVPGPPTPEKLCSYVRSEHDEKCSLLSQMEGCRVHDEYLVPPYKKVTGPHSSGCLGDQASRYATSYMTYAILSV